jgi:hypothetical protein
VVDSHRELRLFSGRGFMALHRLSHLRFAFSAPITGLTDSRSLRLRLSCVIRVAHSRLSRETRTAQLEYPRIESVREWKEIYGMIRHAHQYHYRNTPDDREITEPKSQPYILYRPTTSSGSASLPVVLCLQMCLRGLVPMSKSLLDCARVRISHMRCGITAYS